MTTTISSRIRQAPLSRASPTAATIATVSRTTGRRMKTLKRMPSSAPTRTLTIVNVTMDKRLSGTFIHFGVAPCNDSI